MAIIFVILVIALVHLGVNLMRRRNRRQNNTEGIHAAARQVSVPISSGPQVISTQNEEYGTIAVNRKGNRVKSNYRTGMPETKMAPEWDEIFNPNK